MLSLVAGRRIGTVEPNAARLQGVGPQQKSSVAAGDRLALRGMASVGAWEPGSPAGSTAQPLLLSLLEERDMPERPTNRRSLPLVFFNSSNDTEQPVSTTLRISVTGAQPD